jgi:hypothetical protein
MNDISGIVFSNQPCMRTIFLQCDPKTQGLMSCLSKTWQGMQGLIQQTDIAANRIRHISSHLKTDIQLNFESCRNNKDILAIIKTYRESLNQQFPDKLEGITGVWISIWSIPDTAFQTSLQRSILLLTDEPKIEKGRNLKDDDERDRWFLQYCRDLIAINYLDEALGYCAEIDHDGLRAAVMGKVANKFFKQGLGDRALEVVRAMPDFEFRAIRMIDFAKRPISLDIYCEIKKTIEQIDDEDCRTEPYEVLIEALDQNTQQEWIREIQVCIKELAELLAEEDLPEIERPPINKIMTRAQDWFDSNDPDPSEAIEIYQQLNPQLAERFARSVVAHFFIKAKGDLAFTWGCLIGEENVLKIMLGTIRRLISTGNQSTAIASAASLPDPWSDFFLKKIEELENLAAVNSMVSDNSRMPISIEPSEKPFEELLDTAMGLEHRPSRNAAFEEICYRLIREKNFKMALEYSDNIEDSKLQYHVRREISEECAARDPDFSRQIRALNEKMKTAEQSEKKAESPLLNWASNIRKTLLIADPNKRDEALAGLANEAKLAGLHEIVGKIIPHINNDELVASFF